MAKSADWEVERREFKRINNTLDHIHSSRSTVSPDEAWWVVWHLEERPAATYPVHPSPWVGGRSAISLLPSHPQVQCGPLQSLQLESPHGHAPLPLSSTKQNKTLHVCPAQ